MTGFYLEKKTTVAIVHGKKTTVCDNTASYFPTENSCPNNLFCIIDIFLVRKSVAAIASALADNEPAPVGHHACL